MFGASGLMAMQHEKISSMRKLALSLSHVDISLGFRKAAPVLYLLKAFQNDFAVSQHHSRTVMALSQRLEWLSAADGPSKFESISLIAGRLDDYICKNNFSASQSGVLEKAGTPCSSCTEVPAWAGGKGVHVPPLAAGHGGICTHR